MSPQEPYDAYEVRLLHGVPCLFVVRTDKPLITLHQICKHLNREAARVVILTHSLNIHKLPIPIYVD